MPLAKFNRDATQQGPEIPRLQLDKDEKARIVILDEGPQYRWQHRVSKIALLGRRPKMVTKERVSGDTYEVYDEDWVGNPACTGDDTVLEERGVDPDGCLMCAAARKYPDAFKPPQRRFCMNVFKYGTKPGTGDLQTPFGGQLLVWSFTEKRFTALVGISEEFGDMRTTDLVLGPCSNKQFQNFEVHGSPKAAWLSTDETKKYTAEVYRENKYTDAELMDMCAKLREGRYLKEDIADVVERWEYVASWEAGQSEETSGSSATSPAEVVDVTEALSDLFAGLEGSRDANPEPISRPTTSVTDDLASLFNAPEAADEPAIEPAIEAAANKEIISGITDLDDLLNP